MAIQIVDEKEKFQFGSMQVDGFQFYLRRLPSQVRNRILNKHTTVDKRGNEHTNSGAAAEDMLEYVVLGWEPGSVIDLHGNNVNYDPDNYMRAVVALPEDFKIRILDKAGVEYIGTVSNPGTGQDQDEGDEKN